jgi:hypothetical protein
MSMQARASDTMRKHLPAGVASGNAQWSTRLYCAGTPAGGGGHLVAVRLGDVVVPATTSMSTMS